MLHYFTDISASFYEAFRASGLSPAIHGGVASGAKVRSEPRLRGFSLLLASAARQFHRLKPRSEKPRKKGAKMRACRLSRTRHECRA
jgi:hypothetical protein